MYMHACFVINNHTARRTNYLNVKVVHATAGNGL